MRRAVVAGVVALAAVAAYFVLSSPATFTYLRGRNDGAPSGAPDLENGRTLFFAGGCASCHASPGQEDKLRLAGGLSLQSPYGIFHAPNITPHERDGIGAWGLPEFIRAMREGVSPDGRHYFPSFPYTSYQRMTAADLADLFAFLKTLAPVAGRARDHDIGAVYGFRRNLGIWKLLFLDGRPFVPDPTRSAEWNRGAYLVEGPGHCAECHSPRNIFGAITEGRRFSGGPDPDGKGFTPNITPHNGTGIGGWSKAELIELLRTGKTMFDTVGGAMRAVVQNTSQLSEADRAAMAEYVLSLPPIENAPPKK
jgi:mono/diheme cytochrome c family protein